jgi:hypothetical protein
MYVCQPPVREMSVHVQCCPRPHTIEPSTRHGLSREPTTVAAEDGLTIGHLYDEAKKIIEVHRYCPFASFRMLDDFGFVQAKVTFQGSVILEEDDPVWKEREEEMERWVETFSFSFPFRFQMYMFPQTKFD